MNTFNKVVFPALINFSFTGSCMVKPKFLHQRTFITINFITFDFKSDTQLVTSKFGEFLLEAIVFLCSFATTSFFLIL